MNILRKTTYRDSGLKHLKDSVSRLKIDIQQEVRKVRVMICRMNYLTKPCEECPHTDITKSIELSKNLIKFSLIAKDNMRQYVPKILCYESYKINADHTTKEEEESEKIENKTVEEIRKKDL